MRSFARTSAEDFSLLDSYTKHRAPSAEEIDASDIQKKKLLSEGKALKLLAPTFIFGQERDAFRNFSIPFVHQWKDN